MEGRDTNLEARAKAALAGDPIFREEVRTGVQGEFATTLKIPRRVLVEDPHAVPLLADDRCIEQELIIRAELFSKSPSSSPSDSTSSLSETNTTTPPPSPSIVIASTVLPIHISHSDVRLISDIDDTIKYSNILGGARVAFYNVFAKQLEDLVIKGMGDWYSAMWERGVRFHYVVSGCC